jgi:hypothetical protein
VTAAQPHTPADGPIIVVTFRHCGVATLESALAGQPGLACTSGTGVLPLCAQAAVTWQQVEQNPAGPSAMAATSIRAMAATMITCITAGAGGNRWCETCTAPAVADMFARLFPRARFVCFYRGCPGVLSAVTEAARWGLGRAGIGDFAVRYPGDSVAAAAAYWCARTSTLLDFEAAHQERCLRVRHEELAASPGPAIRSVLGFLGLAGDAMGPVRPGSLANSAGPTIVPASNASPGDGQHVPAELIPGPILDEVNCLQRRLGYPPLAGEPHG